MSTADTPIASSFTDALRRSEAGPVRLYVDGEDQAREVAGKLRQRLGADWRERVQLEVAQRCSSCGAAIVWAPTAKGKAMPLDLATEQRVIISRQTGLAHVVPAYTPHWATCPSADQHRKAGR
jgi:hypothetical protein